MVGIVGLLCFGCALVGCCFILSCVCFIVFYCCFMVVFLCFGEKFLVLDLLFPT